MATGANTSKAVKKSRVVPLFVFLNLIVLGGLLYKGFGEYLPSGAGVTIALINYTPGPMLDVVFEYPGGKLTVPRLESRGQVGHSVAHLADFDATLSFKDEQGHSFKENVAVRPYGGLLVLLSVQPVLETSVVKTAAGAEEAVVKASPGRIFVVRSYQRPGWGK